MSTTAISATSGTDFSFVDQVNSGKTCMSAEGLMIYLQTRLGSLDGRINDMFDKQQNVEEIHKHITAIQNVLGSLKDDKSIDGVQETNGDWAKEIESHLDAIEQVDPKLAAEMRANLEADGGALHGDADYYTSEIKNSEDYLNNVSKQLESSAQLQMIELQSLMSNRQTAVQLASNLISSDNDSKKGVVNNIK